MFKLQFSLPNPFYDPEGDYMTTPYFHREKLFTENKSYNIQFDRNEAYDLVDFDLDINFHRKDHAGPSLNISIFGYTLFLQIYDKRHWNYDADRWMHPDDVIEQDEMLLENEAE